MSRQLQKLIDELVETGKAHHKAIHALSNYCIERWGYEPAEWDLDSILDSVYGAAGLPSGMNAIEFIQIMDEAPNS